MNKVAILILLCLNFQGFTQNLSGTVSDSKSKEPLVYANITLLNENRGVATNEEGAFEFDISKSLKDTLLISYLGYTSKKMAIPSLIKNKANRLDIVLVEDKQLIDEVVLSVKKAKYTTKKKIGIDKQMVRFGSSTPFGFENCVLIKNTGFREGKINSLTFFLKKKVDKLYEVLPTYFRVKFYEYDFRLEKPGKLLSHEQIILKPENKTQKIKLDLKEYHIKYPRHGVCVGIETFNPGKKRDSKIMYLTSPNLRHTFDSEPLTWYSYKGREWYKKIHKWKSKVLGKVKYNYTNPLIHLEVQFKK